MASESKFSKKLSSNETKTTRLNRFHGLTQKNHKSAFRAQKRTLRNVTMCHGCLPQVCFSLFRAQSYKNFRVDLRYSRIKAF